MSAQDGNATDIVQQLRRAEIDARKAGTQPARHATTPTALTTLRPDDVAGAAAAAAEAAANPPAAQAPVPTGPIPGGRITNAWEDVQFTTTTLCMEPTGPCKKTAALLASTRSTATGPTLLKALIAAIVQAY
jgi:hypothetical protein